MSGSLQKNKALDLTKPSQKLSLNLQNIKLADAVYLLAQILKKNVIVSPSVQGLVKIHIDHTDPKRAFDLLLEAHNLTQLQLGNILFIETRDELVKSKQAESKWREALDDALPLEIKYWQIKFAKAEDIARLIHDESGAVISKRGRVRYDARTNVIIVQDTITHLKSINKLISHFDMPVKQLLIETRLASVDSDFEQELGVNLSSITRVDDDNKTVKEGYSIAIAKLASNSMLDIKLSALEKSGHAELISSPSLFTANQVQASIEAGEEVPYQEVSEQGGTAIAFKKAVLGLKVIPHVLPGNKVLLQLQINQDRPSNRMVLGMPTISTRQIITSITVNNGQTAVLGGIYELNHEQGQLNVPFINRIPIIGLLFKENRLRENRRQLLIFVTPKIMM